eukprot:PhM_4_TR15753/c0_g2_i1/m.36133/K12410/npdA; NAD-dependent deacetylase
MTRVVNSSVADLTAPIQDIARAMVRAKNILFITGAGISLDSGLPTYRGLGGLYTEHNETAAEGLPIEVVMSGEMLAREPRVPWRYCHKLAGLCRLAKPNPGHQAIAAMQDLLLPNHSNVTVLTQNVDRLHVRCSKNKNSVIEIHGKVDEYSCTVCREKITPLDFGDDDVLIEELYHQVDTGDVDPSAELPAYLPPKCPRCLQGIVRHDVVLFGEDLDEGELARLHAALEADPEVVISVGSTLVFPYVTEGLLQAHAAGHLAVNINPTDDGMDCPPHVANVGNGVLEPWKCDEEGVGHAIDVHLKCGATEALVMLRDAVAEELGKMM